VAARASRRLLDAPLSGGAGTLDDAYAVQREVTALRLGRGERVVGWKLGYTSRAMREQMGVAEPNLGPLTDVMLLDGTSREAGGRPAVVPGAAVQPRVEPEIALRLGRPLAPGCTVDDVLDACRGAGAGRDASRAGAFACLEVVDSVWSGYRFRLEDNTSDGSSAGWVEVPRWRSTFAPHSLAASSATGRDWRRWRWPPTACCWARWPRAMRSNRSSPNRCRPSAKVATCCC